MTPLQPALLNVGIALAVGLVANLGVRALLPRLRRAGLLRRRARAPRSATPLLIRQAQVVVGDGDVLRDADVLIEQGRITRVETSRIDAPGAQVIEARGRTVIPGLIDAHCHLDFRQVRTGLAARLHARFGLDEPCEELLRVGITTVRTMSEPPALVLGLRDRIRSGARLGPVMVVAGPAFTAPGGHPQATVGRDNAWLAGAMVRTPADEPQARDLVRTLASQGVDLIKLVHQGGHYAEFGEAIAKLSEDVALAIIDEAHAHGLPVAAHTHHAADVAFLLTAGVDSIEHGVLEEEAPAELLEAWARTRTVLVPTLSIAEVIRDANQRPYLPQASRNLARAADAGVRIAAGTDSMIGAMPADTLHHELQLMVAAGLTPAAALQAATGTAAEVLRLRDRGLVKAGLVADLVLLDSDPLDGIESVSDIAVVVRGGQVVHEAEPVAPVALCDHVVPPSSGIEHFTDTTGAMVSRPVEVTVDSRAFERDGVRTITYTDPESRQVVRTETLCSDEQLRTLEWSCVIPGRGTDLRARAHGGRISLSGTLDGKAVSRGYATGGRPWLQGLVFDTPTFITSGMESLAFISIGTSGRGALMAGVFELAKDRGAPGAAQVRARLVLQQWRAFWNATLTCDARTGALLAYDPKGKGEIRPRA